MRDCKAFEWQLLGGIPYRYRYHVENALRSFQASHVMLHIYTEAVLSASPPRFEGDKWPSIIAFGSFGRMDGAPSVSDYDILFLYPGPPRADYSDALREYVRRIVSLNRALPFDHRAQIEAGTFDFEASPAYPILSTDEIQADPQGVRSMQILTEGRAIANPDDVQVLRHSLLSSLGFTQNENTLDLETLRVALAQLKTTYCNGVTARLRGSGRPLTNRKILKLFALREFCYLSTLFALAEVAVAVSAQTADPQRVTQILSAPSILKIASFGDSKSSLGAQLNRASPDVRNMMVDAFHESYGRLAEQTGERPPATTTTQDGGEAPLYSHIRALTLPVLKEYDSLLHVLHDLTFLSEIEPLEPDVMTWLSLRQFRRVLEHRKRLFGFSRLLAQSLGEAVRIVETSGNYPALEDAQRSLAQIADYTLGDGGVGIANR